ncbi:hypothetical protein JCM9492_17540 [Aquifex pyrophilus]
MVVIILILLLKLTFSGEFCGINYEVDIKQKVWSEIGKSFRRTDVILYIPLKYTELGKSIEGLLINMKQKGNNARIYIEVKKPLREDWLLVIPFKNAYVEEFAKVEKIKNNKPSVKEVFTAYPFFISNDRIEFPMPPLNPTEKLKVSIKHRGNIGKPFGKLKKEKNINMEKVIKIVYSFVFQYGRTETEDMNIKNLRDLINVLSELNKLERVEIIGMADGKTRNPKKNEEVAKRRALYIAEKLLGREKMNCLLKK